MTPDQHARTYPRDPKAPPHYLRCDQMEGGKRCIKGKDHPGEHGYGKQESECAR